MAIGLLATITVQEGKNAEFEEAFLGLTKLVRENEPGNIFLRAAPQWFRPSSL